MDGLGVDNILFGVWDCCGVDMGVGSTEGEGEGSGTFEDCGLGEVDGENTEIGAVLAVAPSEIEGLGRGLEVEDCEGSGVGVGLGEGELEVDVEGDSGELVVPSSPFAGVTVINKYKNIAPT